MLIFNTKDIFSEWEISIMKILDVLETFVGLIFLIGITVHDLLIYYVGANFLKRIM